MNRLLLLVPLLVVPLLTGAKPAAKKPATPAKVEARRQAAGEKAPHETVLHDQTLTVAMNGADVGVLTARDVRTATGFRLERTSALRLMRGETVNEISSKSATLLTEQQAPVSFHYEREDKSGRLVLDGHIVDKEFVLETTQSGSTVETRAPAPPQLTFATALELDTRTHLKDGAHTTRDVVLEEMGAIVKMETTVKARAKGRFLVTTSVQGLVTEEEVDAHGDTVVARTPAVGVVAWPKGKAPPDDVKGGSADLLARSTWPAPTLKSPTRVRYRVYTPDAATFAVPEDARQKIVKRDAAFVEVEVVAGNTSKGPLTPAERERLTRATPYEAKDDPRIQRAAKDGIGDATTTREKIKRLVAFVDKQVENKTLDRGYAAAVATLESRSGDCTEHSVLLSALLRASGIPTRLVDGVIVDGHRAGYHEWVEAQVDDEGFVPADPTFGAFPAGPERLKLAEGSTSPDEQLNLSLAASRLLRPGVRIEVVDATPAPIP